ncbi:MAG: hypothetical protein ABI371_06890 [Gelidibacter sp.]
MLILTLNMDLVGGLSMVWIAISNLVFFIFIFREVYRNYLVGQTPENRGLTRTPLKISELEALKKISSRPFFFGLEKKFISDDEFYFDDTNFYVITRESKKSVFRLTAIIEVGKTSIQINNRRIWEVRIKDENTKELLFKFAHNYTFWNKNFPLFLEKVKGINPAAIKSKWSLWTM